MFLWLARWWRREKAETVSVTWLQENRAAESKSGIDPIYWNWDAMKERAQR